jgi:chromate transporter
VVDGVLLGLKACVVALVLQALLKIGKRALKGPLHIALAVGAFVALEWLRVPFPLIVLAAAALGFASAWRLAPAALPQAAAARAAHSPWPVLLGGLVLWVVPLVAVAAALGGDSDRLYLFFTQAALVTFGGAYAVLGYVTQHLVEELGWLTAQQSVAGLALAETTPPLVIVLSSSVSWPAGTSPLHWHRAPRHCSPRC